MDISVHEDIEKQMKIWCASYKNLTLLNGQLIEMDIERTKILEKIDNEDFSKSGAEKIINGYLSEMEGEEDKKEIERLMNIYITPVVTQGMLANEKLQ